MVAARWCSVHVVVAAAAAAAAVVDVVLIVVLIIVVVVVVVVVVDTHACTCPGEQNRQQGRKSDSNYTPNARRHTVDVQTAKDCRRQDDTDLSHARTHARTHQHAANATNSVPTQPSRQCCWLCRGPKKADAFVRRPPHRQVARPRNETHTLSTHTH